MISSILFPVLICLILFMVLFPLLLIRSSQKLRKGASPDAWRRLGMGMGIGIGMLFGLLVGLAIHNLYIGISLGPVLGLGTGLAAGTLLVKRAEGWAGAGEGRENSPATRFLTLLAFGIALTGMLTVVLFLFFRVYARGGQ